MPLKQKNVNFQSLASVSADANGLASLSQPFCWFVFHGFSWDYDDFLPVKFTDEVLFHR